MRNGLWATCFCQPNEVADATAAAFQIFGKARAPPIIKKRTFTGIPNRLPGNAGEREEGRLNRRRNPTDPQKADGLVANRQVNTGLTQ